MPIKLQAAAEGSRKIEESYNFFIKKEGNFQVLNLLPTFQDLIDDARERADKARIFHNTLAQAFTKMARIIRNEYSINKVGLTGGVFQNVLLLRLTKDLLEKKGFLVLTHRQVPTNDGGVSLGQAFLASTG